MLNPYVPGGAVSARKQPAQEWDEGLIPMQPRPLTPTVPPSVQPAVTAPQPQPFNALSGSTTNMPSIPNFQFAEDRLNNMLATDSTYMREAQRRGMEIAGTRGGLNSSIAAGLSTREAIRAAAPIAQGDAQFTQEDYLTGRRAVLDNQLRENEGVRTLRRDSLLADLRSRELNQEADLAAQRDRNLSALRRQETQFSAELTEQARDNDTSRQAWLNQQSAFTSAYVNSMSDARRTGLGFLDQLGSAFINDPETFSPEVVSGMSNFFNGLVSGVGGSSTRQIINDILGISTPATQPVRPGAATTQPVTDPGI